MISVWIYENKGLLFGEEYVSVILSTSFSISDAVSLDSLTWTECRKICEKGKISDDIVSYTSFLKIAIAVSSNSLLIGNDFTYEEFISLLEDNYKLYTAFMKASKLVYKGNNIFIRAIDSSRYLFDYKKIFWMLSKVINLEERIEFHGFNLSGNIYVVFKKNLKYNKVFLKGFKNISVINEDDNSHKKAVSSFNNTIKDNCRDIKLNAFFALMDYMPEFYGDKMYSHNELYATISVLEKSNSISFIHGLLINIFDNISISTILGSDFKVFCQAAGLTTNITYFLYDRVFIDDDFVEALKTRYTDQIFGVRETFSAFDKSSVSLFDISARYHFSIKEDCDKLDGLFGNFMIRDLINKCASEAPHKGTSIYINDEDLYLLYSDILAFAIGYMFRYIIPLEMIIDENIVHLTRMKGKISLDSSDYYSVYNSFYNIAFALSDYYFLPFKIDKNHEVVADLSLRFSESFIKKYKRVITRIYSINCAEYTDFEVVHKRGLTVHANNLEPDSKEITKAVNTLHDVQRIMMFDRGMYLTLCSYTLELLDMYDVGMYYMALFDADFEANSDTFNAQIDYNYAVLFVLGSFMLQSMERINISTIAKESSVEFSWQLSSKVYNFRSEAYFELPDSDEEDSIIKDAVIACSLRHLLEVMRLTCISGDMIIDESKFHMEFDNVEHKIDVKYSIERCVLV